MREPNHVKRLPHVDRFSGSVIVQSQIPDLDYSYSTVDSCLNHDRLLLTKLVGRQLIQQFSYSDIHSSDNSCLNCDYLLAVFSFPPQRPSTVISSIASSLPPNRLLSFLLLHRPVTAPITLTEIPKSPLRRPLDTAGPQATYPLT
jgi:hypothetical protein